MRKLRLGLVLALVISLVCCLPALADEGMNLKINEQDIFIPSAYIDNGTTMIPLDIFSKIAGTSEQWIDDNKVAITGNNKTITLTIGSTEAVSGDETLTITQAPVRKDTDVFIPLRFLASEFGFTVNWDQENQKALLDRVQTRDGMTAMELLIKSNQASQDVNTFAMDGTMQISLKAVADGESVLDPAMNMTTYLEGSLQNEPLEAYIKQKVAISGQEPIEGMEDMVVETYMTEDKMYMKAPGQGWMAMDLPFPSDFIKEQQELQSNPIKAAEQMQEMGLVFSFGDDVNIDGKDYYVINAVIDQEKFQDIYQQTLTEVLGAMEPESVEDAAVVEQMNKIFDGADINYFYTVYIDKTNLISSIFDFDCKLNLNINPKEFATDEEAVVEDIPEKVAINMLMKGTFNIKDLDQPFVAPDVSEATEFNPYDPAIESVG